MQKKKKLVVEVVGDNLGRLVAQEETDINNYGEHCKIIIYSALKFMEFLPVY